MARADFYILNGNTAPSRFSCTVAGKAYSQGNSVYIMATDREEAARLDDLLWTFQDISFLPHACVDDAPPDTPILIGWPGAEAPQTDVMINLTESVADNSNDYNRIVEIIADETSRRERGRERYKVYRERGYEMFNHNITAEQAHG
jgi:DNA polymerase-3 subunit chi